MNGLKNMKNKYDILIVGAGLYGATCARILTDKGYRCLIIEKNPYVGGLCATKKQFNIDVHLYGPHIFHTKDIEVWNFINKYTKFNNYKHIETMFAKNRLWSLPVDTKAYNMMFGSINAINGFKTVNEEIKAYNVKQSSSFEDTLVMQYGTSLYVELFKNYYEKEFNKKCSELAPLMPDMQPSYFRLAQQMYETEMQGIPENGYTQMIENIIGNDIPIILGKDFIQNFDKFINIAEAIIYTGPVDALCKYVYGALEWSCTEVKNIDESMRGTQIYGNAVTKISDKSNDLVRITEHKWFTPERMNDTEWISHNIVSYEYKKKWTVDDYPMHAILSEESTKTYKKYEEYAASNWNHIILGGTKGLYLNMSMDETIRAAMNTCINVQQKN